MKDELTPIKPNIVGAQLNDSAIVFSMKLPVEKLNALARAISKISGSSPWWTGDISLEIQAQKCAEYRAAHPEKDEDIPGELERGGEQFAGEYLALRSQEDGIDHGYRKNCMMVCRFYNPSCRHDTLTFAHHVAAMTGAGGADGKMPVAQQWLKKAAKNRWSAADMRRNVNLALATHTPASHEPEYNPYQFLDKADEWAMQHKDDPLTADSAAKLLTRFEALVVFFARLRQISNAP